MEGRDMHYSMLIRWEPLDKIYVVRIPELQGCVTHGSTYEEAVAQAQDAIDTWVMSAQRHNEELPAPNYYPLDDEDIAAAARDGESGPRVAS